jgi:hypothetical protein
LQLVLIDSTALLDLKSRDPGCEAIQGCSSILYIQGSTRPAKPLHVWLHNPIMSKRRPSTSGLKQMAPQQQPEKPARPKSAWTAKTKREHASPEDYRQ